LLFLSLFGLLHEVFELYYRYYVRIVVVDFGTWFALQNIGEDLVQWEIKDQNQNKNNRKLNK